MIYPSHRNATNDLFLTEKAKQFNLSRKNSKKNDRKKTVDDGLAKVIGVIGKEEIFFLDFINFSGYKRGRSFGHESGAVSGGPGSTLLSMGSKGKLSAQASIRGAAHLVAAAAEEEEEAEGSDSDGGGGRPVITAVCMIVFFKELRQRKKEIYLLR